MGPCMPQYMHAAVHTCEGCACPSGRHRRGTRAPSARACMHGMDVCLLSGTDPQGMPLHAVRCPRPRGTSARCPRPRGTAAHYLRLRGMAARCLPHNLQMAGPCGAAAAYTPKAAAGWRTCPACIWGAGLGLLTCVPWPCCQVLDTLAYHPDRCPWGGVEGLASNSPTLVSN